MLAQQGFPAQFVVDQGRSGQQNLRQQWGDWCNIKGAGFGTRPTTNTGSSLIDAIVWVKPGGESDGTSNSSSPRFDSTCSLVRPCPCPRPCPFCCSQVEVGADEPFLLPPLCSPMPPCPRLRLVPGSRRTSRPSSRRRTPRCKSFPGCIDGRLLYPCVLYPFPYLPKYRVFSSCLRYLSVAC